MPSTPKLMPFALTGQPMSYVRGVKPGPETCPDLDWRENTPFRDVMRFKRIYYANTVSVRMWSHKYACEVAMQPAEFERIAPNMSSSATAVGDFQFVKQGATYNVVQVP